MIATGRYGLRPVQHLYKYGDSVNGPIHQFTLSDGMHVSIARLLPVAYCLAIAVRTIQPRTNPTGGLHHSAPCLTRGGAAAQRPSRARKKKREEDPACANDAQVWPFFFFFLWPVEKVWCLCLGWGDFRFESCLPTERKESKSMIQPPDAGEQSRWRPSGGLNLCRNLF